MRSGRGKPKRRREREETWELLLSNFVLSRKREVTWKLLPFFQFLKLTATTINSREADMLSRFFLRNFLFL